MKKGEIRRGKEARPNPAKYAFKMNSSSVCLFLFPDGITLIKKSLNVKLLVEGGRAEYQGTGTHPLRRSRFPSSRSPALVRVASPRSIVVDVLP